MKKYLSYVNLSLELQVVLTSWLGSETPGTFSLYITQQSHELDLIALNMHILWCRTDICSCKLSAKVDNPFLVLPFVSSRSARKSPTNNLFTLGKARFFWSDPRCFGPLGKYQHSIEISIKTARVYLFLVTLVKHIKEHFR